VGSLLRRDFHSVPVSFHWAAQRQGKKIDEQPGTACWGAAGGLEVGKSYPVRPGCSTVEAGWMQCSLRH
jgi:hypothetical protein